MNQPAANDMPAKARVQSVSGLTLHGPVALADEQPNLRDHWNVLARRRWSVILFALVVLLATAIGSFLTTPVYRASLLLQIEREPVKVVQYQDITPVETTQSKDFYQTQFELLKSRTLAERVMAELDLPHHPAFTAKTSAFDSLLLWFRQLEGISQVPDGAADVDLVDAFLKQVTIEPIKNSRLVRLHYDSPDQALAAKVVNALADNFIDMNLERRFEASSYAKRFLEERLAQMQAKLEYSEEKLVEFARDNGIVNLDEEHNIDLQRLQEMNLVLAQAERDRIAAETAYSGAQGASGTGGIPAVLNNELIQQLKQYKAGLEAEYRDKLKLFKPAYPAMQQLAEQIGEIQRQIEAESGNILTALKLEYETALTEERRVQERLAQLTEEVLAFQDRSIQYNIFRREVETNRELYNGLLQRMKEVGVAGGISANNISVIDSAEIPDERHSPVITLNMVIAAVVGVFGGIGLAFLLEHLDDSIKHPEDLERRARMPVFGTIPEVKEKDELEALGVLSHTEPASGLAEAYRSVRTALLFATPAGAPRILLFTSPNPGEGKTTSALNVAISFTQMDHKVLLIDADLRKPSLHRSLGLQNGRGLTNYLVGDGAAADICQHTSVPGLFIVTSGPVAPNPAELLSNGRMAELLTVAAERFDYVILDGPPVLGLADALVLANQVQGTLVVTEAGMTRRMHLQAALKRLESAKATVFGAILSKISAADAGYGYYANYYYYQPAAGAERKRLPA